MSATVRVDKTQEAKKPRKPELNEDDKQANQLIINNMNKRINYLRNPRFKESKRPTMFSDIHKQELIRDTNDAESSFHAFPSQLVFREYMINHVYEMDIRLTNVSAMLKRVKILPPSKPEFCLAKVTYPAKEDGYVAAGMSVHLKIRFMASSFAEFNDSIGVLMEENILRIPVLARKESPKLDIPELLDCKSCWLGDEIGITIYIQVIEVRFNVVNKGGEAGYRFFSDGNVDEGFVQVGSFRITPVEFFLGKNEMQEIVVIFRPKSEGETHEHITLGCDNETSTVLELKGRGNTVEFLIDGIDDKTFSLMESTFSKVFFKGVPGELTTRRLRVRNMTQVQVNYHWTIFTDDALRLGDDNTLNFNITPSKGQFLPNEVLEFVIALNCVGYYPLSEYANLIIDQIPIEAIRNPPSSLQTQLSQLQDRNGNPIPVFGSNNIRPSITYFEFELLNQAQLGTVEIDPPFYLFSFPITVGQVITKTFSLRNQSGCRMSYQICNEAGELVHEGEMLPHATAEVELGMACTRAGRHQTVSYRVDFNYGDSQVIELIGHCEGASVRVREPMVNFKLVQSQNTCTIPITVENMSDVEGLCSITTSSGSHKIHVTPDRFSIGAHQTQIVDVVFKAADPETFRDFLLVQVAGGECCVLEVFAEVQCPSVSLNRLDITVDCIFCGNTYTFDEKAQNYISLQNLGNIPTPFEWTVPQSPLYMVQFNPQSGILPPKTKIPITFQIKPKQGGSLQELFVCDVQGLEMPLGFEFKADVKGLAVEFELIDELIQNTMSKTSYKINSFKNRTGDTTTPVLKTKKLEKLEFFDCKISQPKQLQFLLKNVSGIHTQFVFNMEHFEASYYQDLARTGSIKVVSDTTQRTHRSSIIRKGKAVEQRPTTLLTDKIEKTQNFNSVDGQQLNLKKKLEQDQRQYLSNNLGVAIVCEPQKGSLPAYGSVVVTVSAFNDICGLFKDNLQVQVQGLPPIRFPLVIDIKGSPVVISPNQLCISGSPPTYELGTHLRNQTNLISREFKVQNTGPKEVVMEWKIYDLKSLSPTQSYFDIRIVDPPLGSGKVADVLFVAQEPPEMLEGCFRIEPKDMRIKGRREKHFTIHFTPGETNVYSAVIVAKPILHEQIHWKDAEPVGVVSLSLNSQTIQPRLYLDKLAHNDSEHLIKFQHWTSGPNKRQEKNLCLVNREQSGFICTLEIEGPFKFTSTSTNSPARYELSTTHKIQLSFNLVQNSQIEALVRFEGPSQSNLEEWPMNYKVYKKGRLNVFFQNGDTQHFTLEGILLRPFLRLNTSGIDGMAGEELIDFGTTHINNRTTQQLFLSNLSSVPAQWKLSYVKYPVKLNLVQQTMTMLDKEDVAKTDDQSVFEFQITEGTASGPSTMVHTLPHTSALPTSITLKEIYDLGIQPTKILINFRPKKNILYKSKYRVTVKDGPPLEFILKGTGTYEEEKEK